MEATCSSQTLVSTYKSTDVTTQNDGSGTFTAVEYKIPTLLLWYIPPGENIVFRSVVNVEGEAGHTSDQLVTRFLAGGTFFDVIKITAVSRTYIQIYIYPSLPRII
jgi:hypothetical protein